MPFRDRIPPAGPLIALAFVLMALDFSVRRLTGAGQLPAEAADILHPLLLSSLAIAVLLLIVRRILSSEEPDDDDDLPPYT